MSLTHHLAELATYLQENGVGVDPIPKVKLRGDGQQPQDTFGPTAFYEPDSNCITLYVAGRHPKDILRSFAHEMIHADQNAKGKLKMENNHDPNYTQNNPELRKLEQEAYLRGNMLFRDWTDTRKT